VTGSATTGSFWRCPTCGKHVPSRQLTCRCGVARADAKGVTPDVSTGVAVAARDDGEEPRPRWGLIGGGMLVILLLAVTGFMALDSWKSPAPADSDLARKIREARNPQAQRQPEIVYIPVPATRPPEPAATSPEVSPLPVSIGVSVGSGAPTAEPNPTASMSSQPAEGSIPVAVESETDAQRRVGTLRFESEVVGLSQKADNADIAWHRFAEGCRQEITTVTAVAGVADRDWIAVAGASVTTSSWTDACADLGTFIALVRQVRDGMCVAEEAARRASVYPGVRREIRHRHRLDWSGWDNVCR
jgi:hypothetical protein